MASGCDSRRSARMPSTGIGLLPYCRRVSRRHSTRGQAQGGSEFGGTVARAAARSAGVPMSRRTIAELGSSVGNTVMRRLIQRATFKVKDFEKPADVPFSYLAQNEAGLGKMLTVGLGKEEPSFDAKATVEGTGEQGDLDKWSVGFVQTVLSDRRQALYPGRRGRAVFEQWLDGPTKDGSGDPWYKSVNAKPFTDPDHQEIVVDSGGDVPRFSLPLVLPAHKATDYEELRATGAEGRTNFGLWLAVKRGDVVRPLREVRWAVGYGSKIDAKQGTAQGDGDAGAKSGSPGDAPAQPEWLLKGTPANDSWKRRIVGWDGTVYEDVLLPAPGAPVAVLVIGDHAELHPDAPTRTGIAVGSTDTFTTTALARMNHWRVKILGIIPPTKESPVGSYLVQVLESTPDTEHLNQPVELRADEIRKAAPAPVSPPAPVDPATLPPADLKVDEEAPVADVKAPAFELMNAAGVQVDWVLASEAAAKKWKVQVVRVVAGALPNYEVIVVFSTDKDEVGCTATIPGSLLVKI